MLIITDISLGLLKYHIEKNTTDDTVIIIKYTSDLNVLENILLESINYNKEGDICNCTYIILYTGTKLLSKDFYQNKSNTTYLQVANIDCYKYLFDINKAIKFNLSPLHYKYIVEHIKSILTVEAFDYFWTEYCIKKFNSNPFKWELEGRRLLFIFIDNNKEKLSVDHIDNLYNKTSDASNIYLKNMFTNYSTLYLSNIKKEDLFLLFIRGLNIKSPVLKAIELYNQDALFSYMCFKESFYKGYIRLNEGVYLLDYLIKNKKLIDYVYIRNLFKLN